MHTPSVTKCAVLSVTCITVSMEALKLVCTGRLRPVDQHLTAQAVAVDQTVRKAHSVRPHWIADAIAKVSNLLVVKVCNGFVLERHDKLHDKSRSNRSGGETLFAGREAAARNKCVEQCRRSQMLSVKHRTQLQSAFECEC